MPDIDPSWGLGQEGESETQPIPVVKSQPVPEPVSAAKQPTSAPRQSSDLPTTQQSPAVRQDLKPSIGNKQEVAPQIPQPEASPDLPGPKTGWPGWIKGVVGFAVVLVLGLGFFFLSEAGFISTGLEGLWGLPNNATKAFTASSNALSGLGNYQLTGQAELKLTSASGESTLTGTFTQDKAPNGTRIQAELVLVGNSTEAAQLFGPVLAQGNRVQLEMINIGQDLYLRIPDQAGEEIWTKVPLSDVALLDLRPFGWPEVLTAIAQSNTDSRRQGGKTFNGTRSKGYETQVPISAITSLMLPSLNLPDTINFTSFLNSRTGAPFTIDFSSTINAATISGNLNGKVEFTMLGQSGEVTSPALAQVDSQTLEVWLTENGFTASESNTGRDAKRKADLREISIALANVAASSQPFSYPVSSDLVRLDQASEITRQLSAFLDEVPSDPLAPERYYGYQSDGSSFKLTAVLEDETDQQGRRVGDLFLYVIESRGIVQ